VIAHRAAQAGLILLCIVVSGAAYLVFDVVVGFVVAAVVGACCLVVLVGLWFAIPMMLRREV